MKQSVNPNLQRAFWHSYYDRATYMVTVSKHPSCHDFGRLDFTEPSDAAVTLSKFGAILKIQIDITPTYNPQIRILDKVIMPDHAHILMAVTEPIDRHFSDIIQAIKAATTSNIRKLSGMNGLTVFVEGFHDRIITDSRQLDTATKYIHDNPRRLAVRQAHPEFFHRVNNLEIAGHVCQAYGNMHLLQNPFKEAVIVHRRDSEETREQHRQQWLYTAANGGVLVSPFISQAEKAIRAETESIGGKIILITNQTMDERYKPAGHDFELCESGRLLIISIPSSDSTLTRAACLTMNSLAETIAHGL